MKYSSVCRLYSSKENIVAIQEVLPDRDQEHIQQALKISNGNIEGALEVLLSGQLDIKEHYANGKTRGPLPCQEFFRLNSIPNVPNVGTLRLRHLVDVRFPSASDSYHIRKVPQVLLSQLTKLTLGGY